MQREHRTGPIHAYWTSGTFSASLEVKDGLGQIATRALWITAAGNTITFPSPPSIPLAWTVLAIASGSVAFIAVTRRVRGRRRRPPAD
jgi:hypothetical protein